MTAGIFAGGGTQALRGLLSGEPWNWVEMAVSVLMWAVLSPVWWLLWRAVDRYRFRRAPQLEPAASNPSWSHRR